MGPTRVFPGGYALTRAIGDFDSPPITCKPDVTVTRLPAEGGRLVLASDGLWGALSVDKVAEACALHVWPEDAAAALMRLAVQPGLRDDVSIIVVDCIGAHSKARDDSALCPLSVPSCPLYIR